MSLTEQRYPLPFGTGARRSGVLEAFRHVAATFGELEHNLPMQPDVHRPRAVERAGIAELLGQLLAGSEAAVELEQLHQVDNRFIPVEVFVLLVRDLRDHRLDLGPGYRLAGLCAGSERRRRRCAHGLYRAGRLLRAPENGRRYVSENAHQTPPARP